MYLETNLKQSITDIYSYGKKFQYDKEKQIIYTNGYDVKGLEFDYVFIIDFNYKDCEASGFTKRDIEESREFKNIFGYRRLFLDKEEIEQV